jgi:hypothetical protein
MKLIFVTIFYGLFHATLAQNIALDSLRPVHSLTVNVQHNSIWTERGNLQPFTMNHPTAVTIDWNILRNTHRAWSYCNCYSNNGLSLGYIDFANPSKLGHAVTFSAFAEPYLLYTNRFQISFRGSAGFAFLNKVYDSLTNRDAIFFSEKVSFLLALGTAVSFRLNDHVRLKATVQFNHISNGGRKNPNEGLNFPGLGLAVDYTLRPRPLVRRAKSPFRQNSFGVMMHVFGNRRVAFADGSWPEEGRLVLGLNAGVVRRVSRLNGVGAGGEVYYDGINSVYGQRSGLPLQTFASALSIQHYLFLGKLLFGQQLAWYVTPNTGFQSNFFQRYFLEYEVKRNWYAGVSLKAHGDQSDFIALSAGYLLNFTRPR